MAERPIRQRRTAEERAQRPVPLEDALLVERVVSGETEAFGGLVRKYQDRVFNTCWRICGNLEDARDLTQEAFLKAFQSLGTFRRESGFYTWVFRVAVNLAITKRRQAGRSRVFPLEDGTAGTQAEQLARLIRDEPEREPARGAVDAELHARVLQALNALEPDQRAVVVLRDIEELCYDEIAAILGIPAGTVKSRLHRARSALADAIRPLLGHDG